MRPYAVLDVSTKDAVDDARNRMAKSVYPIGMDDCEVIGINGGCGDECIIFKAGKCPHVDLPNPTDQAAASAARLHPIVGQTLSEQDHV
jgi:hypothetical protein